MDDKFVKKIITLRANLGKKWLRDIPEIVKQYEYQWKLRCFSPFPLSYNYVVPAKRNSKEDVVLKISFPQNHEFELEVKALKFFDGIGAIKVLQEDMKKGVVLLERAQPGLRIRDISADEEQISIVCEILRKLHRPIPKIFPTIFPTLSDWADVFKRYRIKFPNNSGPIPSLMSDRAEEIFLQFPKEKKEHVLLHGDLHNDNVLFSKRGWLIIDPKGVIGEKEFELAVFLRNPYEDLPKNSNYKKIETERIIKFSERLGFDKRRILDWIFASAIISLLWFLEDENEFKKIYVRNATLLNEIQFPNLGKTRYFYQKKLHLQRNHSAHE